MLEWVIVVFTTSSVQLFLLGLFRTQFECDVSPAMRKGSGVLVVKTIKEKTPNPHKSKQANKQSGGRRTVSSVTSQ